jgi:hypothetical protein
MWFGVDGSTPAQEKMQRDSFQRLWQLAEEAPESSVRVSRSFEAKEYI